MNGDLLPLLDDLEAELQVRDSPERRAWNLLGPAKNGWTARVYDDEAISTWQEVLHGSPGDLSAVHHLAIMHHARAIDLEQSEHPARSDPDWRAALLYWQRLHEADDFWTGLSERAGADPDPVPRVREELPEHLLKLHFDIAGDERSPHHRARFHVRLALDAGFPAELVERVRIQAYEQAVKDLDEAVWRPSTYEYEVLKPAIDAVIRYLDTDDDCATALMDLLRLLLRLVAGWIPRVNALTDRDERERELDGLLADLRRYDGYVTRLESQLLAAAEPDTTVLSEVARWHARSGEACSAAGEYEDSAQYYEKARAAAAAASDPRQEEFRQQGVTNIVLEAGKRAKNDSTRARRLLEEASAAGALPAEALMYRAEAWMLLSDLDQAERDAEAAPAAPLGAGGGMSREQIVKDCGRLLEIIRTRRTGPAR